MKSRSKAVLDKSVSAMLAAIEVYNKPDAFYREESFSVLAVTGWELLLKARLLQLNKNNLSAIKMYQGKSSTTGKSLKRPRVVKNRSGNPKTISIFEAIDRLVNEWGDTIDPPVRSNLEALVEIRDNSIHLINKGIDLERKIVEIGAACLRNYLTLCRMWFAYDLSQYNIFLMPLAFLRELPSAEGVLLNVEERHLKSFLESVEGKPAFDSEFSAALKVDIRLKRSKGSSDVKFSVTNDPSAPQVRLEEENIRETYPWDFKILAQKLRERLGVSFKMNQRFHEIKRKLEKEKKFCSERFLDPGNPKSSKKKFYNPNILKDFEKLYIERPS